MSELRELFEEIVDKNLDRIVLSNSVDPARATKCKVRPVEIKGVLYFQETMYVGTQVFHSNFDKAQMVDRLTEHMTDVFHQALCEGAQLEATVLISKKGKVTIKRKRKQGAAAPVRDLSHNRTKQYILKEGEPVDFLVGLGVQSADGHVAKVYYDKFRQINRYLEFIQDVCDKLPNGKTIRIIDFGCGKSYLTFAMYYYLKEQMHYDIRVTGLDLKVDVIKHCNELAKKLGYDKLDFRVGDIKDFEGEDSVDMVVSLHACDKATDYAIEKAVKWNATVIMAVPCCQHELNKQMKCDTLQPVLKYGLIKERMAALITDALRAEMLEQAGYDTQILEFIDMEHTPKNLLIRAVRTNTMRPAKKGEKLQETMDFLNVDPTLKHLLQQ